MKIIFLIFKNFFFTFLKMELENSQEELLYKKIQRDKLCRHMRNHNTN
jgi:hypothetical protein